MAIAIPGSELKVLPKLYKPLVEHCSLFHPVEFWLEASPFFAGRSVRSMERKTVQKPKVLTPETYAYNLKYIASIIKSSEVFL